jgi:hypothetical protein
MCRFGSNNGFSSIYSLLMSDSRAVVKHLLQYPKLGQGYDLALG